MKSISKPKKSRGFIGQRNYQYETHKLNDDGSLSIIENAPTQEQWKEQIITELFKTPPLNNFATLTLIFHDRDIDITDEEHHKIKGLHCHFIIQFLNPRSYEEIKSLTKCQERNFDRLLKPGAAFKYLTHTTLEAMEQGKTRYNVSELYVIDNTGSKPNQFLQGDDLEFWYRDKIKSNSKAKLISTKEPEKVEELAYKIRIGEIKPEQSEQILKDEFGEQKGYSIYRKERKKLLEDYQEYLKQKKKDLLITGRKLSTIYIYGDSYTGKTRFARELADKINLNNNKELSDTFFAPSENKNTWDGSVAKF